jgi:RNA polymerase sigma-70 factor (ECF subfamily)
MRDVEGMEIAEIAYITSLTENAVTVNLSRARQKIREKILYEQKRVEETIWKK